MKNIILFSMFIASVLMACSNQKKNISNNEKQPKPQEMKAELLQYAQHGGSGIEKITLINDADTFSFLWAERNKNKYPQSTPKVIDFQKQSVILVDFHQSNSGIPKKKLSSIDCKKDTCTINLSIPKTKLNAYTTMAIVKDYMFIATSKMKDNTSLKLNYIIEK